MMNDNEQRTHFSGLDDDFKMLNVDGKTHGDAIQTAGDVFREEGFPDVYLDDLDLEADRQLQHWGHIALASILGLTALIGIALLVSAKD